MCGVCQLQQLVLTASPGSGHVCPGNAPSRDSDLRGCDFFGDVCSGEVCCGAAHEYYRYSCLQ